MPETELISMKYLPDDYFKPEEPPQSSGSKTFEFLFRVVLILGVAGSSWWFYENKDQVLANIRDNSDQYEYLFHSLTRTIDPEDIKEIDVEQPITNAAYATPLDNSFPNN